MLEELPHPADRTVMVGADDVGSQLVHVRRHARYAWAATLARGRRALDAGCGFGAGAVMLQEAGAAEVVAVDRAAAAIEVARRHARPGLTFEVADVQRLPYADASFDLAVCFDVLDAAPGAAAGVAELARVVAADGILALSGPPGVDLEALLPAGLAHRRRLPQREWIASGVTSDGAPLEVRDTTRADATADDADVVVASRSTLLPLPALAVLGAPVELRRWRADSERQRLALAEQRDRLNEMRVLAEERTALRAQLLEAETRLARLDAVHAQLREEREGLAVRLEGAVTALGDIQGSASWRLTRPLRAVKRVLGRAPAP